jgi:hypothetical protein
MWQIYDPVGDVSTVHDTEEEFVDELTESLRRSPVYTERRVSMLADWPPAGPLSQEGPGPAHGDVIRHGA